MHKAEPEIIVEIDAEGKMTISVNGVVGEGCEAFSKAFVQSMGPTAEMVKKPEYYTKPMVNKVTHKN